MVRVKLRLPESRLSIRWQHSCMLMETVRQWKKWNSKDMATAGEYLQTRKLENYKNSACSLPPRQQGNKTWAKSQRQQQNCAPPHTCRINPAINNALRIVTGCLCPTLTDNLPILASIQSAELRHKVATLSLTRQAMEPGPLLLSGLTCPQSGNELFLKSRQPFAPLQNNSSVHLMTTTEVRRSGRITDGMRSDWRTLRHSVRLSLSLATTRLEWIFYEQRGPCLTAFSPISDLSSPDYANLVWPLLRPVCVEQKNKPPTTLSSIANLSTSVWIGLPEGSWRQSTGCSTPTPRSSAAKGWVVTTRSNDGRGIVCISGEQQVDRRVSVVRSRLILRWIDEILKRRLFNQYSRQ